MPLYDPTVSGGTNEVTRDGKDFVKSIVPPMQGEQSCCRIVRHVAWRNLESSAQAQQAAQPCTFPQPMYVSLVPITAAAATPLHAGTFKMAIVTKNGIPGESVGTLSGEVQLSEWTAAAMDHIRRLHAMLSQRSSACPACLLRLQPRSACLW